MVVAKQTGWLAPEAHNGWLDLLAQVGWIGAALASLGCLVGLVFAIARLSRRDDGWFSPIYLVIFLAMSLAESVLLSANDLIWVVFIAVLTQLVGPAKAGVPTAQVAGARIGPRVAAVSPA
jgi:O-antigen ligase